MPRERRGPGREILGRAITCAIEEMEMVMQPRDDANQCLGLRRDRAATAAVLLAIVVSLCGACVVIVETTDEPHAGKHVTVALAE